MKEKTTATKNIIVVKKFISYPDKEKELKQLAADYGDIVVAKETFVEAKNARKTLRDERYGIQKIEKENKAILNDLKSQNKRIAENLIEIIKPTEDKIDVGIKKIEKIEAEEKAERERLKAEQLKKWGAKAQEILDLTLTIVNAKDIKEVEGIILPLVQNKCLEADYGAYALIATQNKEKVLTLADNIIEKLNAERIKLLEEERLEAERLEKIALKEKNNAVEKFTNYFGFAPKDNATTAELFASIDYDKDLKLKRLKLADEKIEKEKENNEAHITFSTSPIDEREAVEPIEPINNKPKPTTDKINMGGARGTTDDNIKADLEAHAINLFPEMTTDDAKFLTITQLKTLINNKVTVLDCIDSLTKNLHRINSLKDVSHITDHIQKAITLLNNFY